MARAASATKGSVDSDSSRRLEQMEQLAGSHKWRGDMQGAWRRHRCSRHWVLVLTQFSHSPLELREEERDPDIMRGRDRMWALELFRGGARKVASSTGLEEEPKDREQACSSSSHWSGRCLEQQAVDNRKADRRQQEGRP